MRKVIKTKIIKGIFLVFFTAALISIFYTVLSSVDMANMDLSLFFYTLGRLVGLIGFLFLWFLIFSGETSRFFDKFFGLDKIIIFQRKFALITAIFVLSHPIFIILSDRSYLTYLIPDFTVLPLALGAISFYIFIIVAVSSLIYKRISYRIWQYIHILIYLLFFFVLYHAMFQGTDYNNSLLIKLLFDVFWISIVIGIIYRTYYKIKQRFAGKFYVKDIKCETKDTFTLILKPEKKFLFKAGQFCFLRMDKNRLYARHPFTISSSPQDKDLHFTIKLAGRFTKIASKLKKGEEIIIEGPFGVFTIEDKKKDLVFIAGGVGIAPLFSIIKEHLDANKTQNIFLLYGSRTIKDIIFKKELDNIKKKWFKIVHVLSGDKAVGMCETGFINELKIKKHVKDIHNSIFYICGPEQMKDCVKKALVGLGVKKQNIKIEDFFW